MNKDTIAGILLLAVAFVWCKKKCHCCNQTEEQPVQQETVTENQRAYEASIPQRREQRPNNTLAQVNDNRMSEEVLNLLA